MSSLLQLKMSAFCLDGGGDGIFFTSHQREKCNNISGQQTNKLKKKEKKKRENIILAKFTLFSGNA